MRSPAPRLALRPDVHLAVIETDVVLLDISADAYLCVPDGRRLLRPAADRSEVAPMDLAIAEALSAAGLTQPGAAAPRRSLLRPSRDILSAPPVPLRPGDHRRLALAVWDLAWLYRNQPLRRLLTVASQPPQHGPAPDAAAETLRLAKVFERMAPWLPIPDKCLARSFVLLRFLQRSGVSARWVFGVRTWPFAAHCWLQLGAVALDDAVERLALYEPVLAVG